MDRIKLRTIFITALISIVIVLSAFKNSYFEISKQLDIFATLFKELNIYYVDNTDPEKLMNEAIVGMLETLDPYTTYLSESEAEEFKVHTSGEYAGIGATIKVIDDEVVVMHIYSGFPADVSGLRVGDRILEIDGQEVDKENSSIVNSLLKGGVGTSVNLKVRRNGGVSPLIFDITRQQIDLRSVPYFSNIGDNVGYICLSSFSRKAYSETLDAYNILKNSGMEYLIFDLRGNPGGLLSQAVKVSNLFLPKNTLVVETKGRIKDWNKKYLTRQDPADMSIPIVILIDNGSASASEIVSGTFQDLDRAMIIGERSYGKGLVQQPRNLSYGTQLKITIAKYYINSGRSIQSVEYFDNDDGSHHEIADSLKHKYKTKNGRTVYDGDGIIPDMEYEELVLSDYTKELISADFIFNYSVDFLNLKWESVNIDDFSISDSELHEFKAYLDKEGYVYRSKIGNKINELKKLTGEDVSGEFGKAVSDLEKQVIAIEDRMFETNKEQIRFLLELNIINNKFYNEGRYEYIVKNDDLVKEAKNLLLDENLYNNMLGN